MNVEFSKTRTRRSGVRLSKALEETLLAAVASAGAEIPKSLEEQSPVGRDLPRDALLPSLYEKIAGRDSRHRSVTREESPVNTDRRATARSWERETRASAREEIMQTTLQQPKPKRPTRPYASFLEDFINPVHPNHPESVNTCISEWLESIGSDIEKRCRSDSHLYHSADDPVLRQLTRSAPNMGYITDTDGIVMPPTPVSTRSRRSYQATEDSTSRTGSSAT